MDVGVWLRELGLEQYETAFRENGVDAEMLPTLTGEELQDIGVSSLRHRRRLLEAIAALRSNAMPAEAPAPVPSSTPPDLTGPPGASETTAERAEKDARKSPAEFLRKKCRGVEHVASNQASSALRRA